MNIFGMTGFEALKRCTEQLSPEDIIHAVTESGLRGRGGGGFPTGAEMVAGQGCQR